MNYSLSFILLILIIIYLIFTLLVREGEEGLGSAIRLIEPITPSRATLA